MSDEREAIAQTISEVKAPYPAEIRVSMLFAREIADRIIAEHISPLRANLADAEAELHDWPGALRHRAETAEVLLAECEAVLEIITSPTLLTTSGEMKIARDLLVKLKARKETKCPK